MNFLKILNMWLILRINLTILLEIMNITLTNFLLVCQLFEDNKKLTIDDYVEVLSAVIKHIDHSDDKIKSVINFFRKFDKNKLFRRLIDLY